MIQFSRIKEVAAWHLHHLLDDPAFREPVEKGLIQGCEDTPGAGYSANAREIWHQ